MEKTMQMVKDIGEKGHASQLMRVLFGMTSPSPIQDVKDLKFLDEGLNDSQKRAVEFALGSSEIGMPSHSHRQFMCSYISSTAS